MRNFLLLVLSLITACSLEEPGQEQEPKVDCQKHVILTEYRTAETTVSCDCRGCNSNVKFLCKDNCSICEDIFKSPQTSNGTFTHTGTRRVFNIPIRDVSSQHEGVYWCGLEDEDGSHRASLRRIQLKGEHIRDFTKSTAIGQNLTYWCKYPKNTNTNTKYICKGEDPSLCERLVTTTQSHSSRFTMKDDTKKRNITITVRDITIEDAGTYWCGAESNELTPSNLFYHRLIVTVDPTKPTTPAPPAGIGGNPAVFITLIVCVVVLLLLLLLHILILIYRRYSKNKRNAAAGQHIKEEYIYEEIPERPQNTHSRQEMKSIYVTANFPTIPSVPMHYSSINFQRSPGDAGVEAPIIRPSSSVCEYSTVKEEPLYSTVNKTQRP